MTDDTEIEIEAVAKALRPWAGDLTEADDMAFAAIAALDAHRASQAHDDLAWELSNFLFTVYDHGTIPNTKGEADAILAFLSEKGALSTQAATWREHSITLNQVAWKIAVALGDVPEGATSHEGNVLEDLERLLSTPEPTVKPDTSIVVGQQMCKPDRAVVAMECYKFHAHDYSDLHSEAAMALALVEADLILALLPGKTEREVAEAAWEQGATDYAKYMVAEESYYNGGGVYLSPPDEPVNPHRAKGATND